MDGDVELGFENAVALRRITDQLSEDPRETAQALARSADSRAADLVEHLLYVHRPSAEQVSRFVRPGVEFRSRTPDFCTRQQAEFYRMVAMKYFGQVVDPGDDELPGFRLLLNVLLVRDRLLCAGDDLRAMPEIFAETKRRCEVPYGQPIGGNNQALWFYAYRRGGASLTGLVDSAVFSPINGSVRADMRRRLADFAMRVAERGLVDEILDKGPDVIPPADRPIDLYDGKPLRIVLADGGVVMYSVDAYGGDDGGTEGIPASIAGRYLQDMTFCLGEAYRVRRFTPKKDREQ